MNYSNVSKLVTSALSSTNRKWNGESHISDIRPIGSILHVGAGNGAELKEYLLLNAEKIILVEPLQRLVKKLERRYQGKNIRVIDKAVSSTAPNTRKAAQVKIPFYEVQPVRFSSLHEPGDIKELFQNLKVTQVDKVETVSLSTLFKENSIDSSKRNVLVLQINGAEYDCLKQLTKKEWAFFSIIIIQTGNQLYFKNARSSEDLIKLFQAHGMRVDFCSNEDAVFSSLIFSKDRFTELILSNDKYKSEIVECRKIIETDKTENSFLQRKLNEALECLDDSNIRLNDKSKEAKDANEKNRKYIKQIEKMRAETKASLDASSNALVLLSEANDSKTACLKENLEKMEGLTFSNIELSKININTKNMLDTAKQELLECLRELDDSSEEKSILLQLKELNLEQLEEKEEKIKCLSQNNVELSKKVKDTQCMLDEASQKFVESAGSFEEYTKKLLLLTSSNEAKAEQLVNERNTTENLTRNNLKLTGTNRAIQKELDEASRRLEASKQELNLNLQELRRLSDSETVFIERLNDERNNTSLHEKECEEQKQINTKLQIALNETESSLNNAIANFDDMVKQKDGRQQSIDLAQKMLAKSQIDLDDLREKFRLKNKSEKELLELVGELREKLSLASEYYFLLQNNHPELVDKLSIESMPR